MKNLILFFLFLPFSIFCQSSILQVGPAEGGGSTTFAIRSEHILLNHHTGPVPDHQTTRLANRPVDRGLLRSGANFDLEGSWKMVSGTDAGLPVTDFDVTLVFTADSLSAFWRGGKIEPTAAYEVVDSQLIANYGANITVPGPVDQDEFDYFGVAIGLGDIEVNLVGDTLTFSGRSSITVASDDLVEIVFVRTVLGPPAADFLADVVVGPAPLEVGFFAVTMGEVEDFFWDFGDGNTSTARNPEHTYQTPGLYDVALTVSGPGGMDTRVRQNYIEVGDSNQISNADLMGSWVMVSGTDDGVPIQDFEVSLVFTLDSLSAFWRGGKVEPTAAYEVFNNQLIAAYGSQIRVPGIVTEDEVDYFGVAIGLGNISLELVGDTLTFSGVSFLTTASNDPVEIVFVRSTLSPPSADFVANVNSGPVPLEVGFFDQSTGDILDRFWEFGDGNTSTDRNPTHVYTMPGNYDVSLTVTGPGGSNKLTLQDYIVVSDTTPVATPSLEGEWRMISGTDDGVPIQDFNVALVFTPDSLSAFWRGGKVQPTASYQVINGNLVANYGAQIQVPGFVAADEIDYFGVAIGLGDIAVSVSGDTLTFSGTSFLSTASDDLVEIVFVRTVLDPPAANFVVDVRTGTVPLEVNFIDQSTGEISGYLWDFGDGNTSSLRSPTHQYQAPGTYTVSLTVTGPGGSDMDTRQGYIEVVDTTTVSAEDLIGDWEMISGTDDGVPVEDFDVKITFTADSLFVFWREGKVEPTATYEVVNGKLQANYGAQIGAPGFIAADEFDYFGVAIGLGDISLTLRGDTLIFTGVSNLSLASDDLVEIVWLRTTLDAPVANFLSSVRSGDVPLEVDFFDQSTGEITDHLWDFGDGSTSTERNPTHTYSSAGIYDVSLTVTGPGGSNTLERTGYIEVMTTGMEPVAAFTANPTSGTVPLTVQFTDQSQNEVDSWLWDLGDGVISTEQNPVHVYDEVGTYDVSLIVTGSEGTDTLVRAGYIEVTPPAAPVAAFTAMPTSGSAPLTVQFTDQSQNQVDTWVWDFGDGNTSTEQNPAHVYTSMGAYDVRLIVTGPGGVDTLVRSGYIQVATPVAAPVAGFSGTPTSGMAPLSVQFTDESQNEVTSWLWDFGDGDTSTEQNPVHQYGEIGTYDVRLIVTGPGGSDTLTRAGYIQVTGPPMVPVAMFSVDTTSGTAPLTVQFTDESQNEVTSWLWDFGDGNTSTEQNPEHTYQDPGTYTVELVVSGPGGIDTEEKVDLITVEAVTSTQDNLSRASQLLEAVFPNPFTDGTWIRYNMAERGQVQLMVYDLRGKLVDRLFTGQLNPGSYQYWWTNPSVPAGTYLVTIRFGGRVVSKQVVKE